LGKNPDPGVGGGPERMYMERKVKMEVTKEAFGKTGDEQGKFFAELEKKGRGQVALAPFFARYAPAGKAGF